MKYSKNFPKTQRQAPKDAESTNHKLLVRAGFMDQLMSGSWTLLPLGQRVVGKINNIIREELNRTGAQEILMPLLHPKEIWNETGRWDSADEIMYKLTDTRDKEFALSFTHEEIFLDLVRKHLNSYKDLPIALYHFSTKFRNELRAKSGILRGREFMMKDLYSVHADEKEFEEYYESVKKAYSRIFERIGFDVKIIEASGGVFTNNKTHEFQVVADGGEDKIYYCDKCEWGENQEIFELKEGGKCPTCKEGEIKQASSIEVGNIFPFGTYYSEKMGVQYSDENGEKKYVHFGSYGIGSTRVMGTWVEVSHDDNGIIWPKSIAPFLAHLIGIKTDKANEIYSRLNDNNIEVLWDDRDIGVGEKFADADLIGVPFRLVVSDKTGDKIEVKKRDEETTKLLSLEEVIDLLNQGGGEK